MQPVRVKESEETREKAAKIDKGREIESMLSEDAKVATPRNRPTPAQRRRVRPKRS
jgi:hypothetical protein